MSFKKHSLCADKIPLDMLNIDIIKYIYCESFCVKMILCCCYGNHKYSLKLLKLFDRAIENRSSSKTFCHIFEGDFHLKTHEVTKT